MHLFRPLKPPGAAKLILIFASMLVIITLGVVFWLNSGMRLAMHALAQARVKAVSARAMNDAILSCLGDGAAESVIRVLETGERVYMLEADPYKMNALAARCAEEAQERIAAIGEQGIGVALGTVTGIPILSGKGPKLRVSFTPAGSVVSEFDSEFVSSGINQTLYRVKLKLVASVQIVMPGMYDSVSVTAEAAIAESLIVGDVPEVYTNVESEEDMLNLVPTEVP